MKKIILSIFAALLMAVGAQSAFAGSCCVKDAACCKDEACCTKGESGCCGEGKACCVEGAVCPTK